MDIASVLSKEFNIRLDYVNNVINLIDEGSTIPFIARYRKELTGSCDDQVLRELNDRLVYLRNLEKRKQEISKSITEQEKMTDELQAQIDAAKTLTEVEDIYRPYKPKRKTRASMAIAKGLKPLADVIFAQDIHESVEELAKDYVDEEKGVKDVESALQGAKDIIAEYMSDDSEIRKTLRQSIVENGEIETVLVENENSKTYEMYKEYSEPVAKIPSHRILAINRGEKEGCLKVSIKYSEKLAHKLMKQAFVKDNPYTNDLMDEVVEDSFSRLLFPSLENECRNNLTDKADEQAIKMFEVNLKPLLMVAPLKNNIILGQIGRAHV